MDTPSASALPPAIALPPAVALPSTPTLPAPAPAKRRGKAVLKLDATALVMAKLSKTAPDGGVNGAASYSRTRERIVSRTKYVLRTGIKPFDSATGGIPGGKVVEIYGLESCGKTALVMHLSGAARNDGLIYEIMPDGTQVLVPNQEVVVLYYDNENSLEEGERIIVNGKQVDAIVGECDTIDQIFKGIENAISRLEEVQDNEAKLAKSDPNYKPVNLFLVVVTDTVAGTTTSESLNSEWGKRDFSRMPAALKEGFRSIIRRLKAVPTFAIFTNQCSDSFAAKAKTAMKSPLPQDADFTTYGGKALRYYAHMRIFMHKMPSPYKIAANRFPDGICVRFVVVKNRLVAPYREGRLVLLFQNAMSQTDAQFKTLLADLTASGVLPEMLPKQPPGGYSAEFSMLEQFMFLKMAAMQVPKTMTIRLWFTKYGVQTPGGGGDFIDFERKDWPAICKEHPEAVQALYDVAHRIMFTSSTDQLTFDVDTDDIGDGDADADGEGSDDEIKVRGQAATLAEVDQLG